MTLREITARAIADGLARHRGNVARTAAELDISERTIQRYIERDPALRLRVAVWRGGFEVVEENTEPTEGQGHEP